MAEKKLEAKESVELTIKLWDWAAETGKEKRYWEKWAENGGEYDSLYGCFLCDYDAQVRRRKGGVNSCVNCPYCIKFGSCVSKGSPYDRWDKAKTSRTRKKYAKLCLEQLREILKDMEKRSK